MLRAEIDIQQNVPLAPLTTLGVGGPARFLVSARNRAEVEQTVAFARDRQLDLFILGGGSNLVVSDRGFDGLALRIDIGGMEEQQGQERVRLDVGAGVNWDEFVAFCVRKDYAGVECLSGIPGSVGGTPVQNVGAYGQEVSETIVSLLAYDLQQQQACELQKQDCGFTYRSSIFNSTQRGRYVILRVTYDLKPGAPPALLYADLQKYFAGRSATPTLAEAREAVLKIRAGKGMVLDPNDPDSRSAGSFFKNPVLSPEQFAQLQERAAGRGLNVPRYPALSQQSKVSAAWLVENSGFHKGYSRGPVAISSKHALALVNRGGATAADILAVRDEIRSKVEQTWGVKLESEPVFLGFSR